MTPIQPAVRRRRTRRSMVGRLSANALLATLAAASMAACDDDPGDPYARTVTLSPGTNEGAAVVELTGAAVTAVTSDQGQVFFASHGDTTRVVLLREVPGPLAFRVQVADPGETPIGTVLQVADGENQLRDAGAYRVEVNP